jgi:hydrogenase maturation protein HypF
MADLAETTGTRTGMAIRVRGQVQGVGFRPTVWRMAHELDIRGDVRNDGEGVLIKAWGEAGQLQRFIARLRAEPPPLARVDSIELHPLQGAPAADAFLIVQSEPSAVRTAVAADAATCAECMAEVSDPGSRRYRYPFTNCTHCGPRLSIIRAIPYDRAQTSMSVFDMCPACHREYDDPADRRFHAQPNACPVCGPRLWLEERGGQAVAVADDKDAIAIAAERIAGGAIVAIKGIGGFHLACDATNPEAVAALRRRKRRFDKPFALMARDVAMVRAFARLNDTEHDLIAGIAAPIVVLDCNTGSRRVVADVAPGQQSLGFMLPYTPLHHILMGVLEAPIVLTSGNVSDEPQCISNAEAREQLADIADLWLMHDREIVNRLDDSVVRYAGGAARVLRRSRGFAPAPFTLPGALMDAPPILAMGGELKSTFCLLKDGEAILSQHIGDLEDASVNEDYRKNLALYRELYAFDPEVVAVDLHPDYLSTQCGEALAEKEGARLETVQHHHAHIAACMAENRIEPETGAVLGVVLDGLGLGDDGRIWGGEFLLADYTGYQRLAHFSPVALPGGAQAMREPWRNTYAYLATCLGWEHVSRRYADLPLVAQLEAKPLRTLDQMMARGLNAPLAVSAGRLFDAAAGALGIRADRISYEGQAAIELESLAVESLSETGAYDVVVSSGSPLMLDWTPLWRQLLEDLAKQTDRSVIAMRFHNGVARAASELAAQLAKAHDVSTIVLSGGVFQNRLLLERVCGRLDATGFKVLAPRKTPANDGGLALGQAAVAAARSLGIVGFDEAEPGCFQR